MKNREWDTVLTSQKLTWQSGGENRQINRQRGNGGSGQNLTCALEELDFTLMADVWGDVSCTFKKLISRQCKGMERARLEGCRQTARTSLCYLRDWGHIKLYWQAFQFLGEEGWGVANKPRSSHLEGCRGRLSSNYLHAVLYPYTPYVFCTLTFGWEGGSLGTSG